MAASSLWYLMGVLCLCSSQETQSPNDMLKHAALQLQETLTCVKMDCNCTFNRQRGCCCATNEMFKIEDETLMRMIYLWDDISTLNKKVEAFTGSKVAFEASMNPDIAIKIPGFTEPCFGPFNTNVPVPYSTVTLNHGSGYNPSLGVFTAPRAGVYVFSYTVYSSVAENRRLYHKVQLMKNGSMMVSVWENNREDGEDSASQVVTLEMQKGDQVYIELVSGRKLCKQLQYNIFTGYMVYPTDE